MTSQRVDELWQAAGPPDPLAELRETLQPGEGPVELSPEVYEASRRVEQGAEPFTDEAAISRYLTEHPEDLTAVMHRGGRNYAPWVLRLGEIAGCAYTAADVIDAWSSADYPEPRLGRPVWTELFRNVGYTHNGEPANPPDEVTLFRGAPEHRRRGMAWTVDREQADWFVKGGGSVHRLQEDEPYLLWSLNAPGSALLAYIHRNGRNASEYVVDTLGLRGITPLLGRFVWPKEEAEQLERSEPRTTATPPTPSKSKGRSKKRKGRGKR